MRHLILIAALAGCATTEKVWMHPTANQQQFAQDRGQCIAQAYAAPTTFQQSAIFNGCMQGKGWALQDKPGG